MEGDERGIFRPIYRVACIPAGISRSSDASQGNTMLPLAKIIWQEATAGQPPVRRPEPMETMDDAEQVRSYVQAYAWGGPTSALQLHHMRELSRLIRPGDTVLDLACGPGPLILELAPVFMDTTFVGVDLSSTMLDYLRDETASRGLNNVSILKEDIRTLPSLGSGQVDLVISTSALHHLPKEEDLRLVFKRIKSLLKPDGGFYMFDFGLLKSDKTRDMFVAEVAKLAPPVTAHDYDLSLQAAFPIKRVFEYAKNELSRPFTFRTSAFVDFFYSLQTPPRAACSADTKAHLDEIWRNLSVAMKVEHQMLRWLRNTRTVN